MYYAPQDALVVVDFQNDFCSGGSLAICGAEDILPLINSLIIQAYEANSLIVASRDWHPKNHISFQQRGGPWPEHCVQGSFGAQFHPNLKLPSTAKIISKGMDSETDQYSAYDKTDLNYLMQQNKICRVFIVGLALDYCVKATAIDAARLGFETHLIINATKSVTPSNASQCLTEMRLAGIRIN